MKFKKFDEYQNSILVIVWSTILNWIEGQEKQVSSTAIKPQFVDIFGPYKLLVSSIRPETDPK